jgi:hypothetical protein
MRVPPELLDPISFRPRQGGLSLPADGGLDSTSPRQLTFDFSPAPPLLGSRLWEHVRPLANGCWQWTDRVSEKGYALAFISGRDRRVHRVIYELLIGPIPDGLLPDHTCRHPWCVNPLDLEPVTNRENVIRGYLARGYDTHCAQGHLLTKANTYWRKDRAQPVRECRACRNAAGARRRERARKVPA